MILSFHLKYRNGSSSKAGEYTTIFCYLQALNSQQHLPQLQFNNVKNNPPLLSELNIIAGNLLAVTVCIIHLVVMQQSKVMDDLKADEFTVYETWIFTKLFIEIFLYRIVGTFLFLFKNAIIIEYNAERCDTYLCK